MKPLRNHFSLIILADGIKLFSVIKVVRKLALSNFAGGCRQWFNFFNFDYENRVIP